MTKKIIIAVCAVIIIILFIVITIKQNNITTANKTINNQQNIVNYEGEYAQYSCNVVDDDECIKSWDIGLIKRDDKIYIIDASFAIWLKKKVEYYVELEPETFLFPIAKQECELTLKSDEGNIYKLIGSFKHSGEFKEYKGKLFFKGKYIELREEKKIIENRLAIECLPSEL